jgi:hypothetical protein
VPNISMILVQHEWKQGVCLIKCHTLDHGIMTVVDKQLLDLAFFYFRFNSIIKEEALLFMLLLHNE